MTRGKSESLIAPQSAVLLLLEGLLFTQNFMGCLKNKLMSLSDKVLIRKRAVIESVNDFLKNICQIEHSRHRSVDNFLVNVLSALIAYSFLPKKPSLHLNNSLSLPFSC